MAILPISGRWGGLRPGGADWRRGNDFGRTTRLNLPGTPGYVEPGGDADDELGFAEDVGRMYDERVAEVMSRIPGSELRDVSQAGLLDVLGEGAGGGSYRPFRTGAKGVPAVSTGSPTADLYASAASDAGGDEGYSPEEAAFQSYWPEVESRLFGSLSRKGFTSGAAPGAAVAKGAAAFAAPLAIEHARGQERRRNQYVQDLFNALGRSGEGARTVSGIPWPDWQQAVQAEGAAEGGGTPTVIHRPGYRLEPKRNEAGRIVGTERLPLR